MNASELLAVLRTAEKVARVEASLDEFESTVSGLNWIPVGNKENNQGPIQVAADPGRSIIERITNGTDAVLEAEYERRNGLPRCQSPREAAQTWLAVPPTGLGALSPGQRRDLAQRVLVTISEGDGLREARCVEVADRGIGLQPDQMPKTILSLNESNKLQKHHLAGVYGQGGSSTFASCKYSLLASRYGTDGTVGFTIVRYNDLPPEDYKVGNYVYLIKDGDVLKATLPLEEFPTGTLVRHFGYDLVKYPSPLGPNSLYGLFNEVLFDPIVPIFLDNQTLPTRQRRTIVGSRNRLNGAMDDDDERRRRFSVAYNVPLYYAAIGEFGQIGIEYWVLERPSGANKRPSAAYVNPMKPIILTHNGQNQASLSHILIRKDCELPFLTQRLICHISCDHLTPLAKRSLFASTREEARAGVVFELIRQEVIRVFKTDDNLKRLNDEARDLGQQEQDKTAIEQMRSEVAKILRIQGLDIAKNVGAEASGETTSDARPSSSGRRHHGTPKELDICEPPTYIKIVWDEDEEIPFFTEQRRYVRIETDANSKYHDSLNAAKSRINLISSDDGVAFVGSTPLKGGRLRGIFECSSSAQIGEIGTLRVELSRPGLPVLLDERLYIIVEKPPVREPQKKVPIPPFKVIPVEANSQRWVDLGWPDNPNLVASSADMVGGTLEVYYSTVFPNYRNRLVRLETRSPALGRSFTERYKVWIAVHSLLVHQDQQMARVPEKPAGATVAEIEEHEETEYRERCRTATLSAIFASREVQLSQVIPQMDE